MGLLQSILSLLQVPQLTNTLITLGLLVFALVLGLFAIHFLERRRRMLHQERMAALIKGLHFAGVARDVFARPRADSRDHLLRGLRWTFGAAGMSGAMYGFERFQPPSDITDVWSALRAALIGLIPAAIGLAHLLFSFLCSRRERTISASPYVRGGLRPGIRRY
jgi:hypothetical protein